MNKHLLTRTRARAARTGRTALLLLCLGASAPLFADTGSTRHHFDVPAGEASDTLRLAARQAGLQIAFPADLVRDLRTQELKGEHGATEAFSLLLKDLGLSASVDEASGSVSIRKSEEATDLKSSPTKGASPEGSSVLPPGEIRGRVTDILTRATLSGTRVRLSALSRETYTDRFGYYQFKDLPAGEHELLFSYEGAETITKVASLDASKGCLVDADLNASTYSLQAEYVSAQASGSARAINEQRASDSLVSIVAADAIGKFPDQNAAESLQRLPGVALYRDQGEGRFVIIRGVNAMYNRVTLNGAPMATPEAGSRNAPLDVIGSDSLGAAEVIKVPTPDMDGEGLGGSVNLRMKSAFDYEDPQAELGLSTNHSNLVHSSGYHFNAAASNFLMEGKLGILLSASTQRRPFGSQNFEEGDGWSKEVSPTDGKEHWVFNQVAYRDYEMVRTRDSANAAIDYLLSPDTTVHLRASYASFNDTENRWVTIVPFTSKGKITALDDKSASFTGVTGVSKRLRMREKRQTLGDASLSFEHKPGVWVFDGILGFSKGQEKKPDEFEARFDTKAASDWSYVFTDPYKVVSTSTGGVDINNPASYSSIKGSKKQSFGEEEQLSAIGNVERRFQTSWGESHLKTGLALRSKDKSLDKEAADVGSGPSGYTFPSLAVTEGDYPYFSGPRISENKLKDLLNNQGSSFKYKTKQEDSFLEDFNSTEDVSSVYLMGGTRLFDVQILGGLRAEHTSFSTEGYEMRGDAFSVQSASSSYTDYLPGIILRKDVGKSLVLRASWTNSLARPAFEETAISRTVDDENSEPSVKQGNPALKPLNSENWDLSAEYYLKSLGLVSVAAFRKDITDFTYLGPAGTDPVTGYPLETYQNGSTGKITGLELAYQQTLRFLPGPLKGLGVFANATLSESEAEYPTRPGEKIPFIGQSETILNLGLSYEYKGFFARIAANQRSPRLREDEVLGEDVHGDRYVDDFLQYDLTMRYRFHQHFEIFAEVINLTDEPFRVYFGGDGPQRLVQFEEYGISSNVGIRWKL